jgi:preprotein translocase subunit Sss1
MPAEDKVSKNVPLEFIQEGTAFLNKCTKPDRKGEYG